MKHRPVVSFVLNFSSPASKRRGRSAILWLIVASAVLTAASRSEVIAQAPTATPTSVSPEWHFRFELFQMLLEQSGLTAVTALEEALDSPSASVIVVLGDPGGTLHPRLMESFCASGGAVLLASDRAYQAGRLAEFRAGPVSAGRIVNRYQRFDDCLIVKDLVAAHPLMEGVTSLVVNRTGWIDKPRWNIPVWQVAARLPALCKPREASDQPLLLTVKIAGSNSGPMILAADQSLFTNGMLWHGDNARLAINISKELSAGGRSRLVFVVNNVSLGSYQNSPMLNNTVQPPMPDQLPEPDAQTLLRVANSVIRNAEESNLLNEVLVNRPRTVRPPYYWRAILFVLAALATLFAIWKLADSAPSRHDPMPERQMQSAHQLLATAKVDVEQFRLSAEVLAREVCTELTGSSDPAVWLKNLSENSRQALSLQEKSQRKSLSTVLNLAVNGRTVHISRRYFESLGMMFQQLLQLHGEQRLFAPQKAATQR